MSKSVTTRPGRASSSRISIICSKINIICSIDHSEKKTIVYEISRCLKLSFDCGKKLSCELASLCSASLAITRQKSL